MFFYTTDAELSSPRLHFAWKLECNFTHAAYEPSTRLQSSPAACAAVCPAKAPSRASLGPGGLRPPAGAAARRHRGRAKRSCRAAAGLRRVELGGPPDVALGRLNFVCKIFPSCNCSIITERIKPTQHIYNVETPQRLTFNAE